MFYLFVAILIAIYYFFAAPKTVKNTMNMISTMGIVAVLIVMSILGFVKLIQSPPEVFVALAMVGLAYFSLRDVVGLSTRPNKHHKLWVGFKNYIVNHFKS
ncbi:DUF3165 family protein [Streptococcus tangpeifui]|uniref:Uncharacterized protein n=1 Tax=Streptococcus criceti HS-6 TaxID=873449 RepID=G5JT84_STRCG|nr:MULTISPECIES: DUF3165 family protein [Streptococcus]EHI75205.1 hypothetical protein STRCR_1053 [Streptococcus criceti HS-6]SUN37628.1 membrane protein [Streptococcus criceti]